MHALVLMLLLLAPRIARGGNARARNDAAAAGATSHARGGAAKAEKAYYEVHCCRGDGGGGDGVRLREHDRLVYLRIQKTGSKTTVALLQTNWLYRTNNSTPFVQSPHGGPDAGRSVVGWAGGFQGACEESTKSYDGTFSPSRADGKGGQLAAPNRKVGLAGLSR